MSYNYDKFSTEHYDLDNFDAPKPGEKAPDFTLDIVAGDPRRLLDFQGDFLVLELGSITCPLFQSRRKGMNLADVTYPNVDFAILYVREAHPGEKRGSHVTLVEKHQCATALRDEDRETRAIFIDDIDGTAHRAYGEFPNAVFIINKNGCVVYRSDWNNPNAVARALRALTSGKPAPREGMFLPAKPPVALETFRRAGKGSAKDFFRGLPKLIWKNLVKRNLRLMFRRSAPIHADISC